MKSGSELMTLKGHKGFVLSCAYSPLDNQVVSASDDKTIKVWLHIINKRKERLCLKATLNGILLCILLPISSPLFSQSKITKGSEPHQVGLD